MEYHKKSGHTLGRIQHIAIMSRIDICYVTFCLYTQTLAPTLPGFQGIKSCFQYLDIHPHKLIFYTYNSYDGSNFIRLAYSGNQVEYQTAQNCVECHQDVDHARILNRRRLVSVVIHTILGVAF